MKLIAVLRYVSDLLKNFLSDKCFVKNFFKLLFGTTGAQVIGVVTIPVLTRMYDVDVFGLQALYLSFTGLLTIFATGRYELAILLPKEDKHSFHIAILSILVSSFLCAMFEIIIVLFSDSLLYMFENAAIISWLYFLPATILSSVLFNVGCIWLNRMKAYNVISGVTVVNSAGNFFGAFVYGIVTKAECHGLLLNTMFGSMLGGCYILFYCYQKRYFFSCSLLDLQKIAYQYSNFPRYLIVGHMLNTFSLQMPVFILQTIGGSQVVGYYGMTQKFFGIPMTLIANTMGTLFMRDASESWQKFGQCWNVYKKTMLLLLLLAAVLYPFIFVLAPEILPYCLGDKWKGMGMYVRYLCPMFFMAFIASPLSSMFTITQNLRMDFIIQVIRCCMVYVSMMGAFYFTYSVDDMLIGYSMAFFVFHVWNLSITWRWSKGETYF